MPAADRIELDFTGVFAIHGIHQQITLKEGKSIIWSRDKLKAREPWIDPVCAGVCGIQQITWGEEEGGVWQREGQRRRWGRWRREEEIGRAMEEEEEKEKWEREWGVRKSKEKRNRRGEGWEERRGGKEEGTERRGREGSSGEEVERGPEQQQEWKAIGRSTAHIKGLRESPRFTDLETEAQREQMTHPGKTAPAHPAQGPDHRGV